VHVPRLQRRRDAEDETRGWQWDGPPHLERKVGCGLQVCGGGGLLNGGSHELVVGGRQLDAREQVADDALRIVWGTQSAHCLGHAEWAADMGRARWRGATSGGQCIR